MLKRKLNPCKSLSSITSMFHEQQQKFTSSNRIKMSMFAQNKKHKLCSKKMNSTNMLLNTKVLVV